MWSLQKLPVLVDFETKMILKKSIKAHKALAELKGISDSMPNQNILHNTIAFQEAKDSSEIENIVTTHDELYKTSLQFGKIQNIAAKEVQNYSLALKKGFSLVQKFNFLSINHIIEIQRILEENDAGFRKLPGTTLKNDKTDKIIYTPPQDYETIIELMVNLEEYINQNKKNDLDQLVKMAIIHFQFESIHPFYDGNGRTGRIINILYLILNDLISTPILYMSRYINKNKSLYYKYLQEVREKNNWENWILFMLDAVEKTSLQNIELIYNIKNLMQDYKLRIRDKYKFYSQDLLNNIFKHPYTKINFLEEDLQISRPTATNYANELTKGGFLIKQSIGQSNYYVNKPLCDLFTNLNPISTFKP